MMSTGAGVGPGPQGKTAGGGHTYFEPFKFGANMNNFSSVVGNQYKEVGG